METAHAVVDEGSGYAYLFTELEVLPKFGWFHRCLLRIAEGKLRRPMQYIRTVQAYLFGTRFARCHSAHDSLANTTSRLGHNLRVICPSAICTQFFFNPSLDSPFLRACFRENV